MVYLWEINQKITEAQEHDVSDFSYIDADGHVIEVHIDDHKELCVDTDFL